MIRWCELETQERKIKQISFNKMDLKFRLLNGGYFVLEPSHWTIVPEYSRFSTKSDKYKSVSTKISTA